MHAIDSLPEGLAPWRVIEITCEGDVPDAQGKPTQEVLELWMRNPVECVAELIGNPLFKDAMDYEPIKEYDAEEGLERDDDGMDVDMDDQTDRIFTEMCSANWWWHIQVS